MNKKEALLLINEYFKRDMTNEIGNVITGEFGTYFELVDEFGHMYIGDGLWLIKSNNEIICVDIPTDNAYFDDYSKNKHKNK